MTVTVRITITKDEANEYYESWKEFNSDDDLKNIEIKAIPKPILEIYKALNG